MSSIFILSCEKYSQLGFAFASKVENEYWLQSGSNFEILEDDLATLLENNRNTLAYFNALEYVLETFLYESDGRQYFLHIDTDAINRKYKLYLKPI